MKRYLFICFLNPLFVISQSVEVVGNLKITEMDTINTEDHLVVKLPDGTLATRMVASLPPPPEDTTRTIQGDLLLTSALCNCPNLPPIMIESLLDNGYSVQDLIDFQTPIADLLSGGVPINDLLEAGVFIVDLINLGVTPMDLFNGGAIMDSLYGVTYEGGLIFYLDTLDLYPSFEGLVASPVNQDSGEWGCYGTEIGGTSKLISFGQSNTLAIVNGCAESGIAARLCDDLVYAGFDDWFLPSKDELNEMYLKLKLNGYGGFVTNKYFSSSEGPSNNTAVSQDFMDGDQGPDVKQAIRNVRAVRAF